MKKYIGYLTIAILALLLLSFSTIGKKRKPVLPAKDSFGHIQWIQAISYHAIVDSSGSILKGDIINDSLPTKRPLSQPIEVWNYDDYGDEIDHASYHANGVLFSRETHIYDMYGNIKEVIDTSTSSVNESSTVKIEQYTYKYDTSGKVLVSNEWKYNVNDRSKLTYSKTINIYDSAGNLRKEMTFDADTINPATVIWSTYNAKKKLVETDERRREGNPPTLAPFERQDFWYDAKGRLYDKATYHAQVGLIKDEKITYDTTQKTTITYSYKENKVITGSVEKKVFSDGVPLGKARIITTQEDTYDADGLLTEYSISHDSLKHLMDKGVFHVTYHATLGVDHKYHNSGPGDTAMLHHIVNDDHFNTVIDDHFTNDGKVLSQRSYQYTYDSIGNWIEKIEFNKDKPVKIIERQIGYFKE